MVRARQVAWRQEFVKLMFYLVFPLRAVKVKKNTQYLAMEFIFDKSLRAKVANGKYRKMANRMWKVIRNQFSWSNKVIAKSGGDIAQ